MLALGLLLLALVTLQRLSELVIAKRNTARLLANGGYEIGAEHYLSIVVMHASWLVTLWLSVLFAAPDILWPFFFAYIAVQGLRFWVLRTLGDRWTTRVIIVPGEKPVTNGPFRFIRHPNYAVVVLEIAILPMVWGLWWVALIWTFMNAFMLGFVRIPAENRAWKEAQNK